MQKTWDDMAQKWPYFENNPKQYNLCAGTVIDKSWIITAATCCKRDDIVTITFNDYSIFYRDQNQHEILSTKFHIHDDLDACLIRTTDMSDILSHIPCLKKVSIQNFQPEPCSLYPIPNVQDVLWDPL